MKCRFKTYILGGEGVQGRLEKILLLSALLLVVFIAGAMKTTSNSAFCGDICHEMAPEYFTWQVSAHGNMSCVSCHSKRS